MNYQPITAEQSAQMLARVGVASYDDLFTDVPDAVRLTDDLAIEGGLTEMELAAHLDALARENVDATQYVSFAGAGIYDHYQPAFIDHLLRRPEFFTAYTPYQPEVSQGTLQAIYEYQTGICNLTGLDVANASMYDGATALAEAAFMAARLSRKRDKVLAAGTLHPDKLATLRTYAASGLIELEVLPVAGTVLDTTAFDAALSEDVAAVLLPYPNYFGLIEDIEGLVERVHEAGALAVLDTNPILLSLLKSPGALGADIAVGEGQPLGNVMSFGGPGLGYFACTTACMRQIPGRLVGRTTDVDGKTGYVLTLATREQHIRREKATSNICSNHALNALAAGMYLAAVGPEGLRGIARDCVEKAHYLHDELLATGVFAEVDGAAAAPFGYEFALTYTGTGSLDDFHDDLFARGYLAGVRVQPNTGAQPRVGSVPQNAPQTTDALLFAVTEKRTKAQIDAFVKEVRDHG